MLEELKCKVFYANQDLFDMSVCHFPWISVSAIDRKSGLVIFMPDGGALTEEDMAVVDLSGCVVEGKEPPVCDTAVHLKLYQEFPEIGSIAHPYSQWATVFSQLDLSIPVLGTIHAETFGDDIPTTGQMQPEVLCDPNGAAVAEAICAAFRALGRTPAEIPAVLTTCQGAYTFGEDSRMAVNNAAILNETAFLAYHTMQLDPGIRPMQLRRMPCRGK